MSEERALEAHLELLMERLRELSDLILAFQRNMEARLDAIGERLECIAEKLDALDARLAKLDEEARQQDDDSGDFIM